MSYGATSICAGARAHRPRVLYNNSAEMRANAVELFSSGFWRTLTAALTLLLSSGSALCFVDEDLLCMLVVKGRRQNTPQLPVNSPPVARPLSNSPPDRRAASVRARFSGLHSAVTKPSRVPHFSSAFCLFGCARVSTTDPHKNRHRWRWRPTGAVRLVTCPGPCSRRKPGAVRAGPKAAHDSLPARHRSIVGTR